MQERLAEALEVAVRTARAAGEMLRAEFHRPGGPRGAHGHAPIDEEIEQLIRHNLGEAFPSCSFLGEEQGLHGSADAPWGWVVDPNDGTQAFLDGFRGSAISIALIHRGLPVLGVVHAPLAPDDAGDLVAWAEGLPLTRNGQEVERAALPAQLDSGQVVLVSHDAVRSPLANARCVHPARFRAVPSIAWRLALVAVGEGDAAVSINGPSAWDLAGGHALLRAVGGDIVDENGRKVRYDGSFFGHRVVGGAPAFARSLAERDWTGVFRSEPADPLSERFPQARLQPGRAIADAGLLRRAQGCLLGQVAGDALGSLVEFSSAAAIERQHPGGVGELADGGFWNTIAGQPTDDSEMALLLARTLVEGADLDAIRGAYAAWLESGPFDVGNTTRSGILGTPLESSQANGGLMRASPLAIFGHRLPVEELAELARAECAITHPHPACRDASAAFVIATAHAIRHGTGPVAAWQAALGWAKAADAHPLVVEALELAEHEPPASYERNIGWVKIALQNAFYQLLHAGSFREGVQRTVEAGGDTDTNGAIAGALLGAVYGRDAVPLTWRRAIFACRPFPGTGRPRPRSFWPVDVLELAERLLLAGGDR